MCESQTTIEAVRPCDVSIRTQHGIFPCALLANFECNGAFACDVHARHLSAPMPMESAREIDLVNRRRRWPELFGGLV